MTANEENKRQCVCSLRGGLKNAKWTRGSCWWSEPEDKGFPLCFLQKTYRFQVSNKTISCVSKQLMQQLVNGLIGSYTWVGKILARTPLELLLIDVHSWPIKIGPALRTDEAIFTVEALGSNLWPSLWALSNNNGRRWCWEKWATEVGLLPEGTSAHAQASNIVLNQHLPI